MYITNSTAFLQETEELYISRSEQLYVLQPQDSTHFAMWVGVCMSELCLCPTPGQVVPKLATYARA